MNPEEKTSNGINRATSLGDRVARIRELSSEVIFAGTKSVTITHDGVEYRLLITRNNKLILQK